MCYPALVALTLVFGFRAVFVRTPWQQTTIVVFAGYFGVATESFIIDTDHWRHTFLLLGLMWGLIAATRSYASAHRGGEPRRTAARPLHARRPRRTGLRVGA